MKKSKVMKITAIAVVIVLIAGAVIWKMLGIRAEGEENQGTTQIDTSKWDTENRVNIVYDEDGVPVPVPKGYTASSVLREFDGEGNKTKDGERTVNTGFVIYEGEEDIISDATKAMEEGEEKNQAIENDIYNAQTTRNQWVWVPVPNIDDIYYTDENGKKHGQLWEFSETGRTKINNSSTDYREPDIPTNHDYSSWLPDGFPEKTKTSLIYEVTQEFENTISSIKNYGGFYIGRYETGDLSKQKLKVIKGNTDISFQSWYTIYRKSKAIVQNENGNVRTNMIWGSLWDQTLEWLVQSGNKTYTQMVDSTSWGNHINSTFEFRDKNGDIVTKQGGYDYYGGFSKRIPTGSTEYTKANNIYDMAGNACEMLVGRSLVGGHFTYTGSNYSVSRRGVNNFEPYKAITGLTARYTCDALHKVIVSSNV